MFGLSAAAVGAIGAVGGALIASNATSDAADTQAQSTQAGIDAQRQSQEAATAEQRRQYDQNRADQSPYRETGARSLGQLEAQNAVPLDPNSVQMDPGYQFARQQGQQGIDRKTAAAGGRISGAALKAASEYNTDYATTGYSTAYNRQNQARSDRLNRLAALAGIGQTSTQQTGVAGTNAANQIGLAGINAGNQISAMTTAQGNASAAGQLAQGNIWSGAGNQLAALYGRNAGTSSYGAPVNMGTATGNDLDVFYGAY